MSNSNTRYLQRLGHSWYVRVKVPPSLQKVVGNTHIRRALGTRDLDQANVLKWAQVKAIKADLVRLRAADPKADEAARIRASLMEQRARGDERAVDTSVDYAAERAQQIEDETGNVAQAKAWFDIATADTPTLAELMEKWLAGEHYKEQTKSQHRAALEDVTKFLGGDRLAAAIDDDVAVNFVEDSLKKSGQSYNTQRRKLNSLVAFWNWLGYRKHIPRGFNPWRGFKLSKARTVKATPDKRPYNESELLKLFATPPEYRGLDDVMVLGLYTGARLEELCALRMPDVSRRAGMFLLTLRTDKGKTRERTIAVTHPHPVAVLARRWRKDEGGQLFPEFKPGGYDGKLSWAVSKAFGRFRDAVGLPRGVDFHSFRRTLITLLENAGADQVMIARYVGHALPTLAFTVYSGGSTEQTSREVARRIKYSAKVERVLAQFLGGAAQQQAA